MLKISTPRIIDKFSFCVLWHGDMIPVVFGAYLQFVVD